VFDDKSLVDTWLDRIHGGVAGGIGRKPWNAEQKTRHSGDTKNLLAQTILDYAEKSLFISSTDRKGKLTTAQRYLGNVLVREAIGIDLINPQDISRTRPAEDFDLLLKTFVTDLVSGDANSRANSEAITKYSRQLSALKGLTGKRIEPESLVPARNTTKKSKSSPKKPESPKHISYEEDISDKLKAIPNYKLERIYYSVCDISLEDHTPLISVGVWSFFECLTALCGRITGVAFPDFISKAKLTAMGVSSKDISISIREALQRISGYGNTTKHHHTSAYFHGEQLANDMDTLKEVICKLAEEAKVIA